jgi:inositol transport system permease protein
MAEKDNVKAKDTRQISFAAIYNKFGTLIILLVIIVVASILSKNFLKQENITNVLRQITVITILGFGSTFVLITGNINIAYDALLALIGCLSCLVMIQTQSVLLSVAIGIVLGAVIGFLYGWIVTYFKMPAFIVGLAINTVARGTILLITNGRSISGIGDLAVIGQGYIGFVPISVLIMLVLGVIVWFLLSKSCFGRHVFAVGGNKVAAKASGIQESSVVRKVYVLDGVLTGIASVIFMSRMASGQPAAGDGYAFDAITGVVVGGASLMGGSGSIVGTLVGASIIGVINNIMNLMNVSSYWQQIVKGLLILIAVVIDTKTKESLMGSVKKLRAH